MEELSDKPRGAETSVDAAASVELVFPVPIVRWRWSQAEAQDEALYQVMQARRARGPGIRRSNQGGWHSEIDLPAWPEPAVRALVAWTAKRAEATSRAWRSGLPGDLDPVWRMNGWANINPAGATNDLHKHSAKNWHWSAVYYLRVSSGESGGALIFEDVGSGLEPSSAPRRAFTLQPQRGELILFPSWLYHRVEAHRENKERVSIAFNLHNKSLEDARLWIHRKPLVWRWAPAPMRLAARVLGRWDQSGNAVPPGIDIDLSDRHPPR